MALKKLASFTLLALLTMSMFAFAININSVRSTPEPSAAEWNKTFGRATSNDANWHNTVVQTEDGGYAIASTADFGAGEVWWLVKTDSSGNVEWNKTYPTTEQSRVFAMVRTSDGGYALAGDTYGGAYGYARLIKTDSKGDMQWNKTYPDIGFAVAFAMIQASDGGYALVGSKYPYDGWLMKTYANGTMQWSQNFVEVNNTQLSGVIQTNDGGFIASGATQYPPFSGKVNAYVVRTDSYGNTIWSKEFSQTTGNDYAGQIIQTSDGDYAIAGETDIFGSGDAWLIKIDVSGNLLLDRTHHREGFVDSETADSIVQTSDGGYALFGRTSFYGVGDAWLIKTDSAGTMLWNATFGGAGYERGYYVIQTSDGGYALAGYTNSFSGDGSYEVWLIKLAPEQRTWIVDDDGPADFSTIQEAINAANKGDTIFVRNGTYYENVLVNKSISLIGEDRIATVIDGNQKGTVMRVTSDNITIMQFTIRNSSYYHYLDSGIFLNGSRNNVIQANEIQNNLVGLCVFGSSDNEISDNNMSHNEEDIWIENSSKNAIWKNSMTNSGRGLEVLWSSDNYISQNVIAENGDGICLDVSSNNTISLNNVLDSVIGIWILENSSCNIISGNNITDNIANDDGIYYVGIYLSDNASYNTMCGNTIANNDIGLYLDSSSNNSIVENSVANNLYGMYLSTESSNNRIYHNNIVDNNQQVYIFDFSYADFLDNGYPSGGNYWSDYSGADANSDGIGDSPYVINANNQDNYPLMKPYAGPHDIGISSVSVSKTVIAQGVVARISLRVLNYGVGTETLFASVYANQTLISGLHILFILGRQSLLIFFEWYTTGFASGTYTITAYVDPVQNEADLSDNTFTLSPVKVSIAGDVNGDFLVNIQDVAQITVNWQQHVPPAPANADINDDGVINIKDAGILALNWQQHA
jgi:parallel beta-helix repeat protein